MARTTEHLAPIYASAVYPLADFRQRTGLGKDAMREARRNGLVVRRIHGRAFVLGSDWLTYCQLFSEKQKDANPMAGRH